ncbi:MAG: RNA methyltransferase [Kiritimatiellales bacterium]
MEQITSVQNLRVKRIAKLQRKAAARRTEKLTVIEGIREVQRAVENGWVPAELWLCHELGNTAITARFPATNIFECPPAVFDKITYRENPDGVLAVGPLVGQTLEELELPEIPLILVAEGLEKPGNLGALLRSADGAGADAVIVCNPATDLNNPNVIRASVGTLFYLPVAEATAEETVEFLRRKNITVFAALPAAEKIYTACDFTKPAAIVVGAEDTGLTDLWKNPAAEKIKIPMCGKNDSLNVSVSAAILLYEAVRQRRR